MLLRRTVFFGIGWSLVLAFWGAGAASAQALREAYREALAQVAHPAQASEFQPVEHLACRNQGQSSVCWSFATTSFLESEMARLKRPSIQLSVMYPVYWEFVEKARRLARTKGASRFTAGDLFSGVPDASRRYGVVPASSYDRWPTNEAPDHARLYAELDNLLQDLKRGGKWEEEKVVPRVQKVLNRHLGEPPSGFSYQGRTYSPESFLAEVVRLPWDDYVMVMSSAAAPFGTLAELKVPDNWQHQSNFFNVPLEQFYRGFKDAVLRGFSVAVDLDTSEPAYEVTGRYCFIPDFDLPGARIGQPARELRLLNGATTDDHVVHVIGYKDCGGQDWFLAKDSWKVAWREGNRGDLFVHGSYVQLKVLAYLVHRDGVPGIAAIGK
jgi:bleomycin hydrolase